jgi:hypothetical protein
MGSKPVFSLSANPADSSMKEGGAAGKDKKHIFEKFISRVPW